jgi:hypothetical protein
MDSKVMDSKVMDSKFMDSKFMDSKVMDSKVMDSKVMDSKFMEGELVRSNPGGGCQTAGVPRRTKPAAPPELARKRTHERRVLARRLLRTGHRRLSCPR